MSKTLALALCLFVSACAIPGLSGIAGISTPSAAPHSGFAPAAAPVHPAPPPRAAPSPASGPSDDEIRAANSKAEHERLDQMSAQRAHDEDPDWGVPPEVQTAQDDVNWLHVVLQDGPGTNKQGDKLIAAARTCSAYVANRVAAGIPATTTINVRLTYGNTTKTAMSLAAADAQICQPLLARAQMFDAAVDAAAATAEAPYRKVGLAGDKLAFALREHGGIFTIGQRPVNSASEIAHANVFFVLLVDNAGVYELDRYEFHGNKRVKKTSAGYLVQPDPAKYR